MDNASTICAYPWTWFSFNVYYGMWRTCPRSPYKFFQTEDEAKDFFNTEQNRNIRRSLYTGVKHDNCIDCWTA